MMLWKETWTPKLSSAPSSNTLPLTVRAELDESMAAVKAKDWIEIKVLSTKNTGPKAEAKENERMVIQFGSLNLTSRG